MTHKFPPNQFPCNYTKWRSAEDRSSMYRQLMELTKQELDWYKRENFKLTKNIADLNLKIKQFIDQPQDTK